MRKDVHLSLTPEMTRELRYLVDEGAAFAPELAQATGRWFTDVDDDLDAMRSQGLVDAKPSELGAPGFIYVPTERAYEVIHGFPPAKAQRGMFSIVNKMGNFIRRENG